MRCRINYNTDPISLTIIAADGKEHQYMDKIGHDGFIEVVIETDQNLGLEPSPAIPERILQT